MVTSLRQTGDKPKLAGAAKEPVNPLCHTAVVSNESGGKPNNIAQVAAESGKKNADYLE